MFSIDGSWAAAVLLLSVRIAAMTLVMPALGGSAVPAVVRVAIVLSWAVLLATLPSSNVTASSYVLSSVGPLLAAVVAEAALGALMGLGLLLAFAAFAIGSRIVDIQIGFGIGQVFEPSTHQQIPVLQAAVTQTALVGFFLLDGHHAVLRGLALSLQAMPLGQSWGLSAALPYVIKLAAQMFSLGFAMLAPVVLCLMAVELGLGVLSRSLPQMNTLVVGMPVKVIVGLSALALWVTTASPLMGKAYASSFGLWEALWR